MQSDDIKLVFQELRYLVDKYPENVKFQDADILLKPEFLDDSNKILICTQIGDYLYPSQYEPYLETAKEKNNFYIFLLPHKYDLELEEKYKDVAKFYYIPSFYSWYTKYVTPKPVIKNIQKHFISLNNRLDYGRLVLFCYFLKSKRLLNQSHFSYVGEERDKTLDELLANEGLGFYLNRFDKLGDNKFKLKEIKKHIPRYLPGEDEHTFIPGTWDWSINNADLYNESLIHIVFETYAGGAGPYPFFTEKIWKPIAMKQPFIVYGGRNSLKELQELGFKTFEPVINESYDSADELLQEVLREIKRLGNQSLNNLEHQVTNQLQDILNHNHNHFYNVLPEIYKTTMEKVGKEIDSLIQHHIQLTK